MKITFIRHAQSKFNSGEEYLTSINCELSDKGKIQCSELKIHTDLLIISPLKRAIQTYANSNIKTKDIEINNLFRECITSPLNKLDFENTNFIETVNDSINRAKLAFEYLKSLNNKYSSIVVISHHDFLHILLETQFGKNIYFRNCEEFTITIE